MSDEPAAPTDHRRAVVRVVRTLIAFATIGVLVLIGRRNASDLTHVHLRLRPLWLVPQDWWQTIGVARHP